MRRFRMFVMSAGALALGLTVLLSGCGGGTKEDADEGGGPIKKKPTESKELKELAGKGKGTLSGRVTLEGGAPDVTAANSALAAQVEAQGDKAICKMGDITQQKWRIGKDGGVKNVFVWLRPPEGQYFKLDADQVKVPEWVKLKQPHCNFEPHALTLFPAYHDPAKKGEYTSTGQKLKVYGSPEIQHNANLSSQNPKQHGTNLAIAKGKVAEVTDLIPDPNTPVNISCDIHKWMNATLWVLDHPYVAITDDDGNYKIENVPTDVPLQVVAWHDVAGWLTKNSKGDTHTLSKEEKIDFKVPSK